MPSSKNPEIIRGTGAQLRYKTLPSFASYQQLADLGDVPQVANPLYQQLFDNNPYRNLHYNKSGWQNFLSKLGFRTDADRWEEEVLENAATFDAGVYQQMYQDQYNSEGAKAERMRAAGENPDLLGTGQVSEAATPYQDPAGLSAGSSEEGVIGQIGSGIISAFNSAVGIASQFMQLEGLRNDVEGKSISNARDMMNVIQQRVLGMTPAEGFSTDAEFANWKKAVEGKLRFQYGNAFFKGSSRRRWNRSIDDFIGGLPTSREQFKDWRERLNDAKDYFFGREDHWSELIDVFKVINEPLIELRKELTENQAVLAKTKTDADIETATNELQYQQDLQPGVRARSENERNRRIAEGETFEGILNKHLSKLGERLDNLSKQGGIKGLIGEVILLLMTMKGNFHFDEKGNPSVGLQLPHPN